MLELYLVSDRSWLNDRSLEEDIEQAILGGVTMVQLREKNLTDEELEEILKLSIEYRQFVINQNYRINREESFNKVLSYTIY